MGLVPDETCGVFLNLAAHVAAAVRGDETADGVYDAVLAVDGIVDAKVDIVAHVGVRQSRQMVMVSIDSTLRHHFCLLLYLLIVLAVFAVERVSWYLTVLPGLCVSVC